MLKDPIIEELHKTREKLAARAGYDVDRFVEILRKEQAASGRKVVSFSRKRTIAKA